MKAWGPCIIGILVTLTLFCSPVLAISKGDLISFYEDQSYPITPSQVPSLLPSYPAQSPIPPPEPTPSPEPLHVHPGPCHPTDLPSSGKISTSIHGQTSSTPILDKAAQLKNIWEEIGSSYKTNPASPFLYNYRFVDTTW